MLGIILAMVQHILATLLLAMVMVMAMDMVLAMELMDMESVKLRLSQRLMPMLSMAVMGDMVLAMAHMDMESVMLMLYQSPMLSMEPMAAMATDLDTVLTPMDMAMGMDMDIMVELSDRTNSVWQ